ncbi:MAG: glycosyltransferase family 1 protein [Candidatus Pacebacteria bacterium]|nr:glycosyltransferase family 1 protein [Candidatus Paceibacterota bacterium]
MKIAIDARSLEGDKTGVGRYLENILKVWKGREDCSFILYFKDEIPKRDFLSGKNFELKRLENPLFRSSNFFFQHFLLPYSLKKDKADFFFSPFYLRPFICPVRSAITLHDISYEAHPEWFDKKSQFILKMLSKMSARKADVIFTVSDYSKGEIMKYYGTAADKIVVTPLAPDGSFYFEEDTQKNEITKNKYGLSKFILCVGTMFTRRHTEEIIEAFEKYSADNDGYQLCLVGKNKTFPTVDIEKMIDGVNVRFKEKKIVHIDSVSEGELMTLYSCCYAVIYLSDYEGFGLPVVEVQFFRKPVITSRNTSLIEVGGESVEFVSKNEIEDILRGLKKVLNDQIYYNYLVAKGEDNIRRFGWKSCADRTLSAISKLKKV